MHFDFTSPKGLKITQSVEKRKKGRKKERKKKIERGEQEKEDKRVEETDTPFSLYNVHFGEEKKTA